MTQDIRILIRAYQDARRIRQETMAEHGRVLDRLHTYEELRAAAGPNISAGIALQAAEASLLARVDDIDRLLAERQ